MPWMTLAKLAFSLLITAIGKIPPEKWSQLGTMLIEFLQKLSDNLPAGHPAFAMFDAYKAPHAKMAMPKPDSDPWAS